MKEQRALEGIVLKSVQYPFVFRSTRLTRRRILLTGPDQSFRPAHQGAPRQWIIVLIFWLLDLNNKATNIAAPPGYSTFVSAECLELLSVA